MSRTRQRSNCALWIIALLTLVSLCFGGCGLKVRADQAIQVVGNTYEVQFSKSITFRLQVETQNAIKEVTLYYRRVGESLTVKVPVSVTPNQNVFTYTWEFEPGEVPVGSRVEYYWHIVDEAGNELKTFPLTLDHEDNRFTWKTLEEDRVILFWYGSGESEARRLLGHATKSLARLQDQMGVTLDKPVKIYVYQSKSDMSLALPRKSEAYDERILTLGVVIDKATLLILGPHPDVEQTIAHELAHVVVGLATDNPYAELPRWLDEGLAMYAEGELPAKNKTALENAIRRDQLISVRSLSGYTGDPAQIDLFYGEVYNLVEYLLRTYGKEKMAQLLAAIHQGLYQEEALQRVYGLGLDDLDTQWRESLGLQPRGMPTPSVPVPRTVERRCIPCPSVLFGGLLGAAAVARWRRRCARAS